MRVESDFNIGTMLQSQDSNKRKALLRREIFTAWILLSAPLTGFVVYLNAFMVANLAVPLFAALSISVALLLMLSWLFIMDTNADWKRTTRFIAFGLIFEGCVFLMTRATGREASTAFSAGSIVIGLILLFGTKRF